MLKTGDIVKQNFIGSELCRIGIILKEKLDLNDTVYNHPCENKDIETRAKVYWFYCSENGPKRRITWPVKKWLKKIA